MLNISSLGENLKVFSYTGDTLVEKDCVSDEDYKDSSSHVSWAGNGLWLCGGPIKSGAVPVYKYENDKLLRMRSIEDSSATVSTFLNWTNQEIMIGNKSGAVNVWDIKSKKIVHTFCEESSDSVTHLSVNADDGVLAVATRKKIRLFGLTTKIQTGTCEYSGQLSALQFSPLKKNFLGGCTLESSIYIWDTFKGIPILHLKNAHSGACSGIAMSPVNYQVLASVSRDRSAKLHDLRSKAPVYELELAKHLTAVDMVLPHALALGTLDGSLLILDLRSSQVVNKVAAHSSPITSVKRAGDMKSVRYVETTINSPDDSPILNDSVELSLTDLLAASFQASNAEEPSPIGLNVGRASIHNKVTSSQMRKSMSPFDILKMEMRRKTSTPHVNFNNTNSLLLHCTPEQNSFVEIPSLSALETLNGNLESPSESIESHPKTPGSSTVLQQILQSMNNLTEENRAIRQDMERVREELAEENRNLRKELNEKDDKLRELFFDMRRLVCALVPHMRWESSLLEMKLNEIRNEIRKDN